MSIYVGVMSGTSLDGIDVVITEFYPNNLNLIAADSLPFDPALKKDILSIIKGTNTHLSLLGQVDVALGYAYSDAINQVIEASPIQPDDIRAIGCHGQTVYHEPNARYPFSMQIGNGNVIAEKTGITTVCDFRQRDMVVGGQGAPLVPAFHHNLFYNGDINRVIVNIGGISNISIIPANSERKMTGFDTGPGNGLMDQWYQLHHSGDYDKGGEWASKGQIHQGLYEKMIADPYFSLTAPKSTGREYFNLSWIEQRLSEVNAQISGEDIQRTLLELTAFTLADAIRAYAEDCDEIYICGGGAYNQFLMRQLEKHLSPLTVMTTLELGLAPDWVEACAFAWLAKRTIEHKTGNYPAVTGASHPTILGAVYYASNKA